MQYLGYKGIKFGPEHEIFPKKPTPENLAQIGMRQSLVYATGIALAKGQLVSPVEMELAHVPEGIAYGYPSLRSAVASTFPEDRDPNMHTINFIDADGGVFPIYEREFFLGLTRRILGNTSVQSILRWGNDLDKRLMDIAGIEAINKQSHSGNDFFIGASASWWWLPRQTWLEKYFIENGFEGYVYGIKRIDPEARNDDKAWSKIEGLIDASLAKVGEDKDQVVDLNLFVDMWHPIAPAANRWGEEGLFLRWVKSYVEGKGYKTRSHFRFINPFFKEGEVLDNNSGQFQVPPLANS